MTDGEVKKVDLDNGKITLKHGDIKNLDMPGMTMVFTVRDKGQLTNLKPGDKVQFMVVQEGGKMIITDIQPVR
jgi:Cu/Ag efflux protein CusF